MTRPLSPTARRAIRTMRQAQPDTWEPYTFRWTDCIKFVVGILLVYFGLIALIVIGTAAA